MPKIEIRKAKIEDAKLILRFVKELAHYERAAEEVVATVDDIRQNLFGSATTTSAVICTCDGVPIGFAVYFLSFSTWLGRSGLYLEDLYIAPEYRRNGAGRALLRYLAQLAVKNGYGRIEWSVLDWNESAIEFYESIGAQSQSEWLKYRLDSQALIDYANGQENR